MARQKNTLSPTQMNDTLFGKAVNTIYVVGIDEFAKRSNVGRTSLFKYLGRNPVNKTIDARIEVVLKKEQAGADQVADAPVESVA